MHFDSLSYLAFVGVVWILYQVASGQWRWRILLASSLCFYATLRSPLLIAALMASTVSSNFVSRQMTTRKARESQQAWLWAGVGANLLILVVTKYAEPLAKHMMPGMARAGLFVTIGVSFFTLQAIGYLVDVYLKEIPPEKSLGRFALYLCFFPKLLQGPIERGKDLLPQLRAPYRCSAQNLCYGTLLFAWGLFKKTAVANRVAAYVNMVYYDVHAYTGISLILATYAYALQIYADFSGYTDMALGIAKVFNIQLIQNFNGPYLATSVADFWRRWHISFSRWILDFIFAPLQMTWRKYGVYGVSFALLATFLFSGFWHGIGSTFLIWGLLHGSYMAASVMSQRWRTKVRATLGVSPGSLALRVLRTCITFNLVCFAWIFFRARDLEDAWYVVTHLFSSVPSQAWGWIAYLFGREGLKDALAPVLMQTGAAPFFLMCLSMTIMALAGLARGRIVLGEQRAWFRVAVYYALLTAILILPVYDGSGFVYFQF